MSGTSCQVATSGSSFYGLRGFLIIHAWRWDFVSRLSEPLDQNDGQTGPPSASERGLELTLADAKNTVPLEGESASAKPLVLHYVRVNGGLADIYTADKFCSTSCGELRLRTNISETVNSTATLVPSWRTLDDYIFDLEKPVFLAVLRSRLEF